MPDPLPSHTSPDLYLVRTEVSTVARAYLYAASGNLPEALSLAAADVVALNDLAVTFGRSTSWGFARRSRPTWLDDPRGFY